MTSIEEKLESDEKLRYRTQLQRVPLRAIIQILANKAFTRDWFNETHNLAITQDDLVELLRVATKHQQFQFNGIVYKQIDGVVMKSTLAPLKANTFNLCVRSRGN